MKKTLAILLMLVLLFNLFGYQALLSVLQEKSGQRLERLIDNNEYEDTELVELKVSLNNPYQQRFTEFERHYGEIAVNGTTYQYVKLKIEGDVMILHCLPNHSKDILRNIAADIARTNSHQQQGDAPSKSSVKIFSIECDDMMLSLALAGRVNLPGSFASYSTILSEMILAIPDQPPREIVLS